MKVIQTIVNKDWVLQKDNLNSILLSVSLAKKVYGNIHLYTNSKTKSFLDIFSIPYDTIDTSLDDYTGKNSAVPRILTYSKQNEPFLHIHHDTFLFGKLNLNTSNKVIVSHSDLQSFYEMDLDGRYTELTTDGVFEFFQKYISVFHTNKRMLSQEFESLIEFDYVPNLSIFGGYDYKSISNASNLLLEIYQNHKNNWDNNNFSSYAIEQLLIIPALRHVSKIYDLKNNDHIKFDLNPIKQLSTAPQINIQNLSKDNNKLKLNTETLCFSYTDDSYKNIVELMKEYFESSKNFLNISNYKSEPIIRRLIKRILSDISVEAENQFLRNFQRLQSSIFDVGDIFYDEHEKYSFGLI